MINGCLFLIDALIMLRGVKCDFDRLFSFDSYMLNFSSNIAQMMTIES